MAMTHEQIDEQMVDFLYGELPADARAAFEAHVAECDRCRREVESFGQVRTVARAVLDEAPPARVHDAILRAAREAAVAAPAKEALKEAKKEVREAEPARASLWDWLRGRWAFPTLATVGALAVFILGSRLFLNPNTVHQIGRPAPMSEPGASTPMAERSTDSTEAPGADEKTAPVTGPAAAEPAPAADAPARTAHVRRKLAAEAKTATNDGARAAGAAQQFGREGGTRPGAASLKDAPLGSLTGSGAGKREKSFKKDDLLEGIEGPARDRAPASGGAGFAEPPPPAADKPLSNAGPAPRAVAKKKAVSAFEDQDMEFNVDSVRAKEEAAPAGSRVGKARAYAQPPPPAPAPRYAEPSPSKAAAAPESYAGDDTPELAKSLPRPAAKPQSRASRSSGAAPAPAAPPPAPAAAPVAASRAPARAEEAESGSVADEPVARETLAQRAERLFTQGRWAEAAVAYRDLLRQQPNSPDAERWRRRLAAARAAVATGRPPPPSSR